MEKETKKPVTFRIDTEDMDIIRKIAEEKGVGYQTLVCSVLHRFAHGTLVDISDAKKILALNN